MRQLEHLSRRSSRDLGDRTGSVPLLYRPCLSRTSPHHQSDLHPADGNFWFTEPCPLSRNSTFTPKPDSWSFPPPRSKSPTQTRPETQRSGTRTVSTDGISQECVEMSTSSDRRQMKYSVTFPLRCDPKPALDPRLGASTRD